MGRDDAKPIVGLQGGTAPARAFHDFMSVAVANRPVEQFETQVPMPDWQLTPEEQVYGDTEIDANAIAPLVDENGMPIGTPPTEPGMQQSMVRPDGTGEPERPEPDQTLPDQRSNQYPPQRQPKPESAHPPDATEPRPQTP